MAEVVDDKGGVRSMVVDDNGEVRWRFAAVRCDSDGRDCKALVDQAKNRIGDWKNKSLSFMGRLQLCNFVLSSMQVYWASVLLIPKGIVYDINQLIRGFLCCNGEYKRGKAKVAWDVISLPKTEGGLGIRNLDTFNIALMTKHIWNIISNRKSLWVNWINIYQLRGRSFWDIPIRAEASWGWRKLLQLWEKVWPFFWVKIGNGLNISVMFDNWCKFSPLAKRVTPRDVSNAGFNMSCRVADFVVNGEWHWPLHWLMKAPNIGRGRICVRVVSRLGGLVSYGDADLSLLRCPLCDVVQDSHCHLFFECQFSSQVWGYVCHLAEMENVHPLMHIIIIRLISISHQQTAKSIIGRLIVAATSYFLWLERNNRLFKNSRRSPEEVRDMIMTTLNFISTMRDPESKNPNSVPPLRGSDDVTKPKRVTRSATMDDKLAPKYTFAISKPALGSGRKGSKKGSFNDRDLKKELDELEYDDDVSEDMEVKDEEGEVRDEDIGGIKGSDGLGSGRDEGIKGNEGSVGMGIEKGSGIKVSEAVNQRSAKEKVGTSMGQGNVTRSVDKGETPAANVNKVSDDMPGSGDSSNVVWPSLNEVSKKNNASLDKNSNGLDTKILYSAIQGMSVNGNNKLSRIPVRVNKKGKNVVDMDPLLDEGNKKCDLTLVGSVDGINYVVENGPWLVEGKPLFVQKWEAGLCMEKPEPSKNIITASMCERTYGRASFARVLVEVDASKELMDSIELCHSSLGKSMTLTVEYAWKPPLCTHCRVFGYEHKNCNSWERTSEGKSEKENERMKRVSNVGNDSVKTNDGRKDVGRLNRNGAGTSIIGMSLGIKVGVGSKYVLVKNKIQVVKVVDDVQVMDEKGGDAMKDKGKTILTVEIGGDEWVQMKGKIDFACNLGMQIGESEKCRWSKDLVKYYEDKCKDKARTNMVEALKWRTSKLQKDISYGNTNVSKVANEEAGKQCVMIMKKEGITRNQAFLKAKVNDMIKDNEWDWPIDWDYGFGEVTNVLIKGG
ncbi:hypothetical protein Tco_0139237 [Tanacetum coccineum]